ncbi:MAG: efflux RND transporter permease subunit, partial [Simkaniaceae bacterium]|nr:efflux RND transporter permease subunit [Simkaniaceae bacterium]
MNLSKPFIRRPVMTTLIMLPLIIFGIFAYKHLPVSAIPVIESSTVVVTTSYPGASADEVARYVSAPLERQFILMQGIQFVSSENDYQSSTVICQFHNGVDINVAAQNVQNAINQAAGDLPPSLPNPPSYTKANPSDTPILYAVVHSKQLPYAQLYQWGYTFIGQQIGTVQGIADIQTYGYPYAVRVKADPQALASRDISFDELAHAINNSNPDLPTGAFYGPNRSIQIMADGQMFEPEAYNDLIIKYQDGEPVRLRDVATATHSLQNDKSTFRWITKEGGADEEEGVVVLAVLKQQGFNTVDVCNNILALMEKLKSQLPASVELTVPFTQSVFISQAVEEVEFTLLVAFLLVVLVVFIYLGKIRNSIIPLIALPITVTGTFILMYVCGYNIDIMSMSAITLSIGFLVDDAIIVLENIVRYVEQNEKPYKAALIGSKQIILTVVSISLCLAAVFIPMLFLGGAIGKIFHEFGAVIIIAIVFSAFISVTLTPMLCSRFIPPHNEERKTKMEIISEKINAK